MKIFVTGATGFIGLNLTHKLSEMGHTVHALCRSEEKARLLKDPAIKVFFGHIMDIKSLQKGMNGCDAVIHMAAFARVWSKNSGHFDRINVQGTVNVMDTARQSGVSRIIITSTAGVFGPSVNDQPVDESGLRAVDYFNDYERTKDIADQKALSYNGDDMEVITVHPTRVFGPGLISGSNAVTTMIKQYIAGKWHLLPGNGKSVGNYVFIDDVVMGHILALEKGKAGE
jgi:farnesol dehydrogenase